MKCARWCARRAAPGSTPRSCRAKASIAVEGDLLDPAAVHRAADGVDVVYHIAATYREAGQRDSAYRAINVDGTRNVLEAAKAGGARRVVHCSTGGVHGHIANPPANEDAPFNPGDVYQETKLEAEQAAREFGNAHRLRCGRGAADWNLRTRRHEVSENVPRPRAAAISDDRQRPGVLSPDVHRRSGRRVSTVRHRAGREGPHLYPGGPSLHDARTTGGPWWRRS